MPLRNWCLLASLHMTQYLGMGFFYVALVALLRAQGVALEKLGFIWLLGLISVFKFTWAPLIDRFGIRRVGHYRGWLLLAQSGMVVVLVIMGFYDIAEHLDAVIGLCVLFNILVATQDNAAHAVAWQLLPAERRGMGNGIQFAGGLLGNILGGGGVLLVYPVLGWQGAMMLLAFGTAVSLVQLLFYRESVDVPRESVPSAAFCFGRFFHYWKTPGLRFWMLLLAIYPVGVSMGTTILTPMLVDAGWSFSDIGLVVNINGCLLGVVASLATGYLINRYGRKPVLIGAIFSQAMGLSLLMVLTRGHTDTLSVYVVVGSFFLLFSPASIIVSTLMMDRTSAESPATDFSMQFSFFTLASAVAGMLSPALAAWQGYGAVVIVSVVVSLVALVLSLRQVVVRPPAGTTLAAASHL